MEGEKLYRNYEVSYGKFFNFKLYAYNSVVYYFSSGCCCSGRFDNIVYKTYKKIISI